MVAVFGVGFIVLGIEMARREHWPTAVDREAWEERPTFLRRVNYLASVAVARVVAPVARRPVPVTREGPRSR